MPNIGPMELAIVLIIALVIVGPKKLPELGKSAGQGFREFKDSVTGGTTTTTRSRGSRPPRRTPRSRSGARSSPAARSGPRSDGELEGAQGRPRRRAHVVDHLDELRTRIIVSAFVLVVAVGLCFWQNGLLLEIANAPLPGDREPITFGVTEPFFTTVKLSLYAGSCWRCR